MKAKYFSYSLLLFLLFIISTTPVFAENWKKIDNGLHYKKLTVKDSEDEYYLHAFKINPRLYKIEPLITPTQSIQAIAKSHNALLAVNANFFDTNNKPLGLVTINRVEKNKFKNISWWGILCMNGKWLSIKHSSQYKKGACSNAIQAGPRIVINGNIPKLKNETSRKTAIGINKKGEMIIVASSSRIPIKTLANSFRKKETEGGLDCPNALNLDGGSSSQLYFSANDFELSLPSFVGIPVSLIVKKKKQ